MIQVRVRMMGILREAAGRSDVDVSLEEGADISSVIQALINEHGKKLKGTLLDPVIRSALPNTLIIINGVEIGNLQGLDTPLWDGDNLVLLPVTHGG